ncbi:MAG TPA: class F sortase [Candidatus Saccharimonadales bacterium]|nr:class F sortase [Candidatus Saccharimonadales bacterium]
MKLPRRRPLFVILLAVALLAGAGGYSLARRPQVQTQPPAVKHVVKHTTDHPSEAPIAKAAYVSTAGPAEPKYINLPTIGTQGFIEKMGIDQHNQVAAPGNVNLAGWYVNSALPGQPGLSIIDGHVDGLSSPGIFKNLGKLKPGDQFTVQQGNNTTHTYSVRSVTSVSDGQAVEALFSQDPSVPSELNLITCGGAFNRATKEYEQRVVVAAALL